MGIAMTGTTSCSATPKGSAHVLAISTDMQAPQDVDLVSVFITTDSVVKFDYLGRVLPSGTVALPATLAIVEPDDPNAKIRIRVNGFKGANARVLRGDQHDGPARANLPCSGCRSTSSTTGRRWAC